MLNQSFSEAAHTIGIAGDDFVGASASGDLIGHLMIFGNIIRHYGQREHVGLLVIELAQVNLGHAAEVGTGIASEADRDLIT